MPLPARARLGVVCFLGLVASLTPMIAAAQDPYDQSGAPYGRGFFAPLPWERIDTVTGNLFLSFTDLSLPGNAGMNLSVVRTYNSRDGRWRFGIAGAPLSCLYTSIDDVTFVTADGGKHQAAGVGSQTMTQQFWRFTKSTRVLEMPGGTVATYGHTVSGVGAFLTQIADPFGNTLTLTWQSGAAVLQSVTQNLGAGQTRTVTFSNWVDDMPNAMTYNGRTWTYEWQTIAGTPSAKSLMSVIPPVWEAWAFNYTNDSTGAVKLNFLYTPNGGQILYTWATDTFPTTPSTRIAIKTRAVTGTSLTGTWTFDWTNNGSTFVITGPTNKATYGIVVVNDIPVGSSQTVETLQGAVVQSETLSYTSVQGALGLMPVLQASTVVRDGRTFTTTYSYGSSNYADYGQPNQIVESGELSRTTAITYEHGFSSYIRGRVASSTVTVGAASRSASSVYNMTTGFVNSSTVQGVTTTYTPDAYGNVASATDATARSASSTYEWGVVKTITAGGVTTSRTLNSDGTIATETAAGLTSTYGYDAVGRVTSITNNGGLAPVTIEYINSGSGRLVAKKVTTASVWVHSNLDGLGRAVHTVDSAGVNASVGYNAVGQATYRSRPYGGSVAEVGNTYTYDALGRPTGTVRGGDGSTFDQAYVGREVRFAESLGGGVSRYHKQTYSAFSPGDARLVSVHDATEALWEYGYNGFGQLTGVYPAASGAPVRTWTYHPQGWLASATQPESGTTSYSYDNAGRVTSQTDARGVTVTSTYDTNGRLSATTNTVSGSGEDVAYTYDGHGRLATVANATVQSTLSYDAASRLVGRTDVIAGRSFTHGFQYDAYGNLTTAVYPITDRRVIYEYDAQQRVTAVKTKLGEYGAVETLASNLVYRGDGSLQSYTYGNGQTFSVATRDSRNRPEHFVNGPLDVTYTYDHVGNVKTISDARQAYSAQYSYDLLDRLTAVSGYGARSYVYNGAGDRTSETSSAGTITYNYDGQRRLGSLSGSASGSFAYDATGNLTSDPSGTTYTYSALGAQKTSTIGGQTTTYAYGSGGSRSVKTGPDGIPHLYVYGAGGGPIAEYKVEGGNLVLVREYIYLGGTLLAAKTMSNVTAPPMSVSILTPTPGSSSSIWTYLTLTASVSVGSGLTLARVEYYCNGVYVGQSSTGNFSVPWLNVLVSHATFIARLVLTDGRAVSSAPVTVAIQ